MISGVITNHLAKYRKKTLNDQNRFYRNWNGPNYTSLKSYQITLSEKTFIYVVLII